MSIAVVQGASGGLGRGLATHILRNTSLKVYALTHQSSTTDLQRHLESESGVTDLKDRLTIIGDVDLSQEDGIGRSASIVRDREGKASVRMIACLAGIVSCCHAISANELTWHTMDWDGMAFWVTVIYNY